MRKANQMKTVERQSTVGKPKRSTDDHGKWRVEDEARLAESTPQ